MHVLLCCDYLEVLYRLTRLVSSLFLWIFLLQVDGVNLENKTNLEAVEVLKKTGSIVKMKLARPRNGALPRKRSSGTMI